MGGGESKSLEGRGKKKKKVRAEEGNQNSFDASKHNLINLLGEEAQNHNGPSIMRRNKKTFWDMKIFALQKSWNAGPSHG